MKRLFIFHFLILISLSSCVDKTELDISLHDIEYLSLMDPYEQNIDANDLIQDTVFYHFGINQVMLKIRYDYSQNNGTLVLDKIDSVRIEYFLDENSLFMHRHPDDQLIFLPTFGKDYAEWKILELNSDTMIIDAYIEHPEKGRVKSGHWGFSVQ